MNEFSRPDGVCGKEDNYGSQTDYDEPSTINIVVDDEDDQLFCRCGNPIEKGDVFCSRCGTKTDYAFSRRVDNSVPTAVQTAMPESYVGASFGKSNLKSKSVALVLCFFFGLVGGHRFYEGRIVSGILKAALLAASGIGFAASALIMVAHGFGDSLLPFLLSFTAAGVSVIGWLVDFIVLITKPKKYDPKPPK